MKLAPIASNWADGKENRPRIKMDSSDPRQANVRVEKINWKYVEEK